MKTFLLEPYLHPTYFIDSNEASIIAFAKKHTAGLTNNTEKAIQLYNVIRDNFRYTPYQIDLRPFSLKASSLLKRDYGYCIEKACLLAAVARVEGIPSRLGFANVRNHIGAERFEELIKTNLMVFHGYTELFLEGKWVKATPAFNARLCAKIGVAPLEFDGKTDSIFQEYIEGETIKHMEYVHDYGVFHDVPYDLFIRELCHYYPHLETMILTSQKEGVSLFE